MRGIKEANIIGIMETEAEGLQETNLTISLVIITQLTMIVIGRPMGIMEISMARRNGTMVKTTGSTHKMSFTRTNMNPTENMVTAAPIILAQDTLTTQNIATRVLEDIIGLRGEEIGKTSPETGTETCKRKEVVMLMRAH